MVLRAGSRALYLPNECLPVTSTILERGSFLTSSFKFALAKPIVDALSEPLL